MLKEPGLRRCKVCDKTFESIYSTNFCTYYCYRKYKLPSKLKKLSYSKALNITNNGIATGDKNKIIFHSSESLKHFLIKSLVCRILFERKHSFVCEALIENGNKVDICDLSMQIVYEVEPNKTDRKMDSKFGKYGISPAIKDIIIIPYEKIPDDVNAAYDKLKEIVV